MPRVWAAFLDSHGCRPQELFCSCNYDGRTIYLEWLISILLSANDSDPMTAWMLRRHKVHNESILPRGRRPELVKRGLMRQLHAPSYATWVTISPLPAFNHSAVRFIQRSPAIQCIRNAANAWLNSMGMARRRSAMLSSSSACFCSLHHYFHHQSWQPSPYFTG